MRSTPEEQSECPECGGACLGPEDELFEDDCMWFGNRLARMDAARPPGARRPDEFAGYPEGAVDDRQLAAFEAGVESWWLVVPPGPGDDPDTWHFAG